MGKYFEHMLQINTKISTWEKMCIITLLGMWKLKSQWDTKTRLLSGYNNINNNKIWKYQMVMRMWSTWNSLYSYVYMTFWTDLLQRGLFGIMRMFSISTEPLLSLSKLIKMNMQKDWNLLCMYYTSIKLILK